MRTFSGALLEQANSLVTALKSLDYQRIVSHYPEDVSQLRQVLIDLGIDFNSSADIKGKLKAPLDDDDLNSNASKPSVEIPILCERVDSNEVEEEASLHKHQQRIFAQLSAEGFGERIGQIYSSLANSRVLPFNKIPHHRGIPAYDIVMAPDFAPVSGMHGIFISQTEIMSVILPSANPESDWQVLKSKPYKGDAEMIEYLTLIAAGFDIP